MLLNNLITFGAGVQCAAAITEDDNSDCTIEFSKGETVENCADSAYILYG